jgi:hypothetical protein
MGGLGRWIQGNSLEYDLWMTIPDQKFRKETLSEGNYRLFIGFALDVLLKPWERFVMGLKYTEVRPPISNCKVIFTFLLAWCREV